MTAIQRKVPIANVLFPHWVREGPRNTFDVWHRNPLKQPYFVASFQSHDEAIAYAKHLNALYREESDAIYREAQRGPSLLRRMLDAVGQTLRLRS